MLWLLATPLCKLSSKAFLIPSPIFRNMGQQTLTLKKDNNEFSLSICFFLPFLRNSNVLWKQGSTISSTPTLSRKVLKNVPTDTINIIGKTNNSNKAMQSQL